MTTIICDRREGVMAGDGLLVVGGRIVERHAKKVKKFKDYIIGLTGDIAYFDVVCNAINKDDPDLLPDLGSDGYWEAFALHAGGDLFHYHSSTKLNPVHLTGDFHAIGSGAEYALGAMASGKMDAQAAIKIVSLYDVTTNDVVTLETWNNGKKGDILWRCI